MEIQQVSMLYFNVILYRTGVNSAPRDMDWRTKLMYLNCNNGFNNYSYKIQIQKNNKRKKERKKKKKKNNCLDYIPRQRYGSRFLATGIKSPL